MKSLFKQQKPRDELLNAFRVFDHHDPHTGLRTGMVNSEELVEVMKNFGETMTPEELAYFVEESGCGKAKQISIEKFVEKMLAEK